MKINSGSNEACPHTQRIHQPRGCGFNSHLPILSPMFIAGESGQWIWLDTR